VEASIGSRAERRSGSGAAAEDGGAGADLQRQSAEGATGRTDQARASIRRLAVGRSRIGGRADGELDAGGALPNSRFALFSPPSPLFSLSSALSPFPC